MTDTWIEAGLIGVLICDDNVTIRRLLTEIIELEPGLRWSATPVTGTE